MLRPVHLIDKRDDPANIVRCVAAVHDVLLPRLNVDYAVRVLRLHRFRFFSDAIKKPFVRSS